MSKKPLIGITGDFRPEQKESQALSWFFTGYYDSVTDAGGIPVMMPPLADDDDLKQFLEQLDGLILSGCALDLDPIRLGFEKHPASRAMPLRREDFDRRVCTMAMEMKMPLLAIGSGMQLMNVISGGTLHQHVTEDVPGAMYHRDGVEANLRHIINIEPGTRVDKMYGPGEIRVNSQHHMAVKYVSKMFVASATAPDGVIEAIEVPDEDWFCVGVQWHPQNHSASALDMQVFENFLSACEEPEPQILQMPVRKAA
ncbi:gamma-glutamyl-gamma-aminobutyrate hydrolase family protein [Gimesia sp.]|uniref:gamma-glutamyl-gamma-aminobutyrate hydrolase family protein n=1 Tax=Gimesia sp. TaxID=2024833 RepID=UPI003A9063C2